MSKNWQNLKNITEWLSNMDPRDASASKKSSPSVPAWGAPCRRGSYEAKPDSRQSGSTHCLLSLLCNQPFAWGKEKGTLTRKKGQFSKNHCYMTPNISAVFYRPQPNMFWLESERRQSNYQYYLMCSFSRVAVHICLSSSAVEGWNRRVDKVEEVFGYPAQPSAGQLLIWTDNASRGDEGRVKGV